MKKTTPQKNRNHNADLVFTPAGPRPKGNVHAVGQDKAVRVNATGKAKIEPRNRKPGTIGDLGADFVITHGGLRERSLVHQIEPGHTIRVVDGHHMVFHPS
jgi:hypothetical protein